ncbi:MAG: DUF5367 family protein [Bacteroidota bacterium]
MQIVRTLVIGILIWIIGVSLYSLSFFVPFLKDATLQANLILSFGILPVVWFGTKLYYRGQNEPKGYWVGLAFFLIAGSLDALITVPYLIIPDGGSYFDFFTAIGFWLIGIEFILMATLYWYTQVRKTTNTTHYS